MKLTNDRSKEVIESPYTHEEAYHRFVELFGQKDSWLHFWVHKAVLGAPSPEQAKRLGKAIAFLGDTFLLAQGMGLKRPMIRLHFQSQRFKIYLSGRGTLCLKTGLLNVEEHEYRDQADGPPKAFPVKWGHDPVGDEYYVGCWSNGKYLPVRQRSRDQDGNWRDNGPIRQPNPCEAEFLARLEANPVAFLAECSKDMGRCCYCNLPLEDARSKRVGYGATCAKRWGLPWGNEASTENAPSFAKSWDENAEALIAGIREHPASQAEWDTFADWLEEKGLPRCKMPAGNVVVPRS